MSDKDIKNTTAHRKDIAYFELRKSLRDYLYLCYLDDEQGEAIRTIGEMLHASLNDCLHINANSALELTEDLASYKRDLI